MQYDRVEFIAVWLITSLADTPFAAERVEEIFGQQRTGSRPALDAQQKLRGRDRT